MVDFSYVFIDEDTLCTLEVYQCLFLWKLEIHIAIQYLHDENELVQFYKVEQKLKSIEWDLNLELICDIFWDLWQGKFIGIVNLVKAIEVILVRVLKLVLLILEKSPGFLHKFSLNHFQKEFCEDWEKDTLQLFFVQIQRLINKLFQQFEGLSEMFSLISIKYSLHFECRFWTNSPH